MGYLHIDGKGMQANGGSRYNDFEARTIAAWLAAHKEEIEHHYSKPLHELVGIVTPFSAQVSAIKSSLLKLDINCSGDENSLTVGTVHSLQGAERAIVLFSPVYSKHEDGGFIDRDSSMLNVAVSRAKDSFWSLAIWTCLRFSPLLRREGCFQNTCLHPIIMHCSLSIKNARILIQRKHRSLPCTVLSSMMFS
jgi:superfamily I DNA and/or RNA helicase